MNSVEITTIKVTGRYRKEFGDIAKLADSIEKIGLLHPVVINQDGLLVCGERRIKAFQLLGRTHIPARVLDMDDVIFGEHDENENREDFRVSEKVAIGEEIERRLGSRQGQRTDRLPENFPEVKGRETRDIAAEKAGFGNGKTYQQAKSVVHNGAPELVEAVDAGELSVSAAANVAMFEESQQREVVSDIASGMKPSEAVKKHVHVAQNSGENEWYTPSQFIDSARNVMGVIDLDPASSEIANRTVKASKYHTKDDSGLDVGWTGSVWLNPPYAQPLITQFAEKVVEQKSNTKHIIVLVNNATETKWFQLMAKEADALCFPQSRIKFIDVNGDATGAPLQGQAFLYFGDNANGFCSEFSQYGFVVTHAL